MIDGHTECTGHARLGLESPALRTRSSGVRAQPAADQQTGLIIFTSCPWEGDDTGSMDARPRADINNTSCHIWTGLLLSPRRFFVPSAARCIELLHRASKTQPEAALIAIYFEINNDTTRPPAWERG